MEAIDAAPAAERDTLGGAVVDGGLGLYETATGTQVDEAGWLPDLERGVDRLETAGQAVGARVENPGLLVEAVVDPIRTDWNEGRYGEAIGRGVAEGVSLVPRVWTRPPRARAWPMRQPMSHASPTGRPMQGGWRMISPMPGA